MGHVDYPNRSHRRKFFHTRWEDLPKPGEVRYLIEKLLPAEALAVLYAPTGLGKTDVALRIANAVANGTPFHGRTGSRGNVLYIDYEMGKNQLQRYGDRLELKGYIQPVYDVPLPELPRQIREATADGCTLVIIDSYASLANQSGNENAVNTNSVAESVLKPLADLAHELGITILVLHHTNKGEVQFDGSQRIKGLADVFYRLSLDRGSKTMTLKEEKGRFETELLAWDASGHPRLQGVERDAEDEVAERRDWVLKQLQPGTKSRDDLDSEYHDLFQRSSKSLERDLGDAVEAGLVVKEKLGRKNVYRLATAPTHQA